MIGEIRGLSRLQDSERWLHEDRHPDLPVLADSESEWHSDIHWTIDPGRTILRLSTAASLTASLLVHVCPLSFLVASQAQLPCLYCPAVAYALLRSLSSAIDN